MEADYEATDLETVIQDMLSGQYTNPIRVIAFNTAERWSEDVSADVALEYGGAATCRCGTCRLPSGSPTAMKAVTGTYSYRCPCVWPDPWRSSARSQRRSASRR